MEESTSTPLSSNAQEMQDIANSGPANFRRRLVISTEDKLKNLPPLTIPSYNKQSNTRKRSIQMISDLAQEDDRKEQAEQLESMTQEILNGGVGGGEEEIAAQPSDAKKARFLVNKWTTKTVSGDKIDRINKLWKEKLDATDAETKAIFQKSSLVYSLSEQLVTAKIDYFLGQGIPKSMLMEVTMRYPQLYNFSLEKTIIPNVRVVFG
jgi:hypothetical protein